MNKLILLAALVAAASAGPAVKITNGLAQTLDKDGKANIFVSFVGGNTNVVSKIENQSFQTRADRLTSLKTALELNRDSSQQIVQKFLKQESINFRSFWISNEISIKGATKEIVQALASFPEVALIEEEQIAELGKPQVSKRYGTQASKGWGVDKVQAPAAWATTNGTGIVVANIDGGVRPTHEALKHNYREGHGWLDAYAGRQTAYDDNGHGSHTMGSIAGALEIGVAPGATWIACKACSPSGSCPRTDLTACGEFTLCPTNPDGSDADCSKAPHLVSNSWGGGQGDLWYQSVTDAWIAGGIVPIFAIGNSGSRCATANSPGDMRRVIGVGATDEDDVIAYFSSVGPATNGRLKPDISAPGVDIVSAGYSSDTHYMTMSGTSMACPHAAGVTALLLSVNPNLTFGEVWQALIHGVDTDLSSGGAVCGGIDDASFPNHHFGHGRLNALKIVENAKAALNQK